MNTEPLRSLLKPSTRSSGIKEPANERPHQPSETLHGFGGSPIPVASSNFPNVSEASRLDTLKIIPMSGLTILPTKVDTTDANATPMTKPTAMSTRLPLLMNSLNSSRTRSPFAGPVSQALNITTVTSPIPLGHDPTGNPGLGFPVG